MGWETGLAIAFLLVGVGVFQAMGKVSGSMTEFLEAYRDVRGEAPVDRGRLAALEEEVEALRDRLGDLEERTDFTEELLRDASDRGRLDTAAEPSSGVPGGGSNGSTNPNDEETS